METKIPEPSAAGVNNELIAIKKAAAKGKDMLRDFINLDW